MRKFTTPQESSAVLDTRRLIPMAGSCSSRQWGEIRDLAAVHRYLHLHLHLQVPAPASREAKLKRPQSLSPAARHIKASFPKQGMQDSEPDSKLEAQPTRG